MPAGVRTAAVWLLRLATGATFAVSGWAKCTDPWGFVIKIQEYLAVWGWQGVPRDAVLVGAVALSLLELVTGVALATGSLRRSTPVCGLAMMAVMLPLTVYIYAADPVADCGCFGDFLIISNGATLAKNIVLTAALALLLVWHGAARPLLRPSLQWLALAIAGVYGLTLAVLGWQFQPTADFRPYPAGSQLISEESKAGADVPEYVYSKGGREERFALDSLPDSTWTFVRQAAPAAAQHEGLAVFDGDEEVTDDVLGEGARGDMMILVVNNPGIDYLTRARLTNEINAALEARGGRMIGLVAASGDALEQWIELARPDFEVYSASDTSLKELARGDAALVGVRDGRILWKNSLATIDPAIVKAASPLDAVTVYDDGRVATWLTLSALICLAFLTAIDYMTRGRATRLRAGNKREEK